MPTRLLSLAETLHRVSLSKSTVYRRMHEGTFPSCVRIGPKRVAFVESEVEAWIAAQIDGGRAHE